MKKIPLVSIVGRVNTGKSTLFNRIIKKPLAITDAKPGLTRDRIRKLVNYTDIPFYLTDTGGLYPPEEDQLWEKVREKIEQTVDESDLIIFVIDASTGIVPYDEEIAEWLRKKNKEVILVANKIDIKKHELLSAYSLGFGDPIPISSAHGRGLDELLEEIVLRLKKLGYFEVSPPQKSDKPRIAILGKTNVGKSSLFNALCEAEEAIVSPIPGTTRDSLDVETEDLIIVDTAGIRRKYADPVELFGAIRSQRSLRYAEIAVLVLDASQEISNLDKKIANLIVEEGRGIVVALNKADLIEREKRTSTLQYFKGELNFIEYAPVLFTSAVTREGINLLKEVIKNVKNSWQKHLTRKEMSEFFYRLSQDLPFSVEISKITQIGIMPPAFKIISTRKLKSHELKFIERKLRESFGFMGTPIKFENEVKSK